MDELMAMWLTLFTPPLRGSRNALAFRWGAMPHKKKNYPPTTLQGQRPLPLRGGSKEYVLPINSYARVRGLSWMS